MYVYSVRDEKTGIFFQPFFEAHDVVAIRIFKGALRSKDNMLADFPEDYALYRIGYWDDKIGEVQQTQNEPERLGFAYEFMNDNDNDEEPG